ncbi:hypothetical protein N8813_01795 [bacterium]|nr:hypothetical protein [bacterium]MDA7673339.1 hypothetical protein [Verrucomicrobiales bacterium]MDB4657866.1 hypothetical protein [Verrucomicrobiales bacterium]MDC0276643.1 hypothetical protein [Verrucomicrobiales bacterium]MDC0314725.1 hypothetical protein [bacterium]
MKELNVVLIKADATKPSEAIDYDLFRFNRSNLPVNVIVPADPDQPLIMMPELISPKQALKALEIAAEGRKPKSSSL